MSENTYHTSCTYLVFLSCFPRQLLSECIIFLKYCGFVFCCFVNMDYNIWTNYFNFVRQILMWIVLVDRNNTNFRWLCTRFPGNLTSTSGSYIAWWPDLVTSQWYVKVSTNSLSNIFILYWCLYLSLSTLFVALCVFKSLQICVVYNSSPPLSPILMYFII